MQHPYVNLHCGLIAEIHACLISVVQERPFERHCAIISLLELKNLGEGEAAGAAHEKEDDWQVEIDELIAALADVGVSWETTVPQLFESPTRDGWEAVIVGFLKDVGFAFRHVWLLI